MLATATGQQAVCSCSPLLNQLSFSVIFDPPIHWTSLLVAKGVKTHSPKLGVPRLQVTFNSLSKHVRTLATGTMGYMSPELFRQRLQDLTQPLVTPRPDVQKMDVYSVGVVAYLLLSGAFPHKVCGCVVHPHF